MTTRTVTLRGLEGALTRDMRALKWRIERAMKRAAKQSARGIIPRTPKAFGELRDSIHAAITSSKTQIIVDAPHAAAVEVGSRPHLVPLEELVKWVKLRGMQGLTRQANIRKPRTFAGQVRQEAYDNRHGPTTRQMARAVAGALKKLETNGSLDVDAPIRVAKAIQMKIAKQGTRPHHFVAGSLDTIVIPDLDTHIKRALRS